MGAAFPTAPPETSSVFFSPRSAQEALHGAAMHTHASLLRQPLDEARNRQTGVRLALGSEKVLHLRRTLDRPGPPGPPIPQTCHAAAGKASAEDVEGLAAVAEVRAHLAHRAALDEVPAEHLVLDLQFVAGVEELRMRPEQPGPHTSPRRAQRPRPLECLALVGPPPSHRG